MNKQWWGWGVGLEEKGLFFGVQLNSKTTGKLHLASCTQRVQFIQLQWQSHLNPALTVSTRHPFCYASIQDLILIRWRVQYPGPHFNKMTCGSAAYTSTLPKTRGRGGGRPHFCLPGLQSLRHNCSHISFGGCFMPFVRRWPRGGWASAPKLVWKFSQMAAQITGDCSCESAVLWSVQLEQLSRLRPSKNNYKNK